MFKAILTSALVAVASPALAAVYQVEFTGTVSSVSDQTGIFGYSGVHSYDASNPYTGMAYTQTFIFDTSLGTLTTDPLNGTAKIEGGEGLVVPTASPVTGSLTLDGVTVSASGLGNYGIGYARIELDNTTYGDLLKFSVTDRTVDPATGDDNSTTLVQTLALPPGSLTLDSFDNLPLLDTAPTGLQPLGSFTLYDYNQKSSVVSEYTNGYLNADHVTITRLDAPVSTVPLPASGLILVSGLGVLAAARRRRGRLAA